MEVWAAFTDPSNNPSYPGWPLRNLLLLAAKRWGCQSLQVICVRDSRGHMDVARSLHLTVQIPTLPDGQSGDKPRSLLGCISKQVIVQSVSHEWTTTVEFRQHVVYAAELRCLAPLRLLTKP